MTGTFQECDTCAAKPGTPYLCSGCLNNRDVIYMLDVSGMLYRQATKCRTVDGGGILLALKAHLEDGMVYDGCEELWQVADLIAGHKKPDGEPFKVEFVPDETGGHIEFNGKVWRPEE